MTPPRVLVLDDEESVRDLWVETLREAGYAVTGLGAGAEALARLPDLQPNLILLDMMMPEMDGYEFLARLRATAASEVPLLIVSSLGGALGQAMDGSSARTLGVAGILPKPLNPARLLLEVGRVVGPGRPGLPGSGPAADA